jgi:hypothetical protein
MEPRGDKFLPSHACYVPLPLPAIRNLVDSDQRAASRVLYALCVHLGTGLVAVFPSYPTISKYAYISENGIRGALNVLVKRGYVSIEKKRDGRKTINHYTVLDKAYTEQINHSKGKREDSIIRICETCYEDVSANETYRQVVRYYAGTMIKYRHTLCWPEQSGELLPDSPGNRFRQEHHWKIYGRKNPIVQEVDDDSQSLSKIVS